MLPAAERLVSISAADEDLPTRRLAKYEPPVTTRARFGWRSWQFARSDALSACSGSAHRVKAAFVR
jgi:hypothetical protein